MTPRGHKRCILTLERVAKAAFERGCGERESLIRGVTAALLAGGLPPDVALRDAQKLVEETYGKS